MNDRSIELLRAALRDANRDVREGSALLDAAEDVFNEIRREVTDPGTIASFVDRADRVLKTWDYSPEFDLPAEPREIDTADRLGEVLREAYEGGERLAFDQLLRATATAFAFEEGGPIDRIREALGTEDDDAVSDAIDALVEAVEERVDETAFETLGDELERRLDEGDDRFAVLAPDERVPFLEGLRAAVRDRDPRRVAAALERLRETVEAINEVADARRRRLDEATADRARELEPDTSVPIPGLGRPDPIVMLPVRLETSFDAHGDGDDLSLRIRVYPDDVHVDTHEPELTPDEIEWGIYFWRQLWWASHAVPSDRLPDVVGKDALATVDLTAMPDEPAERYAAVKERVWAQLVERYDRNRAAWIKRALAPGDAATLLDGPHPPEQVPRPDFDRIAAEASRRPASWTRPPRARLLPDRWVVFVETDRGTRRVLSEPVTKPLPIGPAPDALAGTGPGELDDDVDRVAGLLEGPADWMFDFDAAKRAGMAVELSLAREVAEAGVNVLAIGVETTMGADAAATALGDLLDAHHYTDGLSIVPRGTPTNDTEDGPAGGEPPSGTRVECGPSLLGPNTDGTHLTNALSLDVAGRDEPVFAHVAGADRTDERDAAAMNTACWSATLGYTIPHLFTPASWEPGVPRPALVRWLDAYRRHFVADVRSSPFPALRVGDQPYGVLPTTDLSRWEHLPKPDDDSEPDPELILEEFPRRFAPPSTESFEQDLVDRVRTLREQWDAGLGDVSSLAPPPTDERWVGQTLVSVLGMEAIPFQYRLRYLTGVTSLAAFRTGQDGPFDDAAWERLRRDESIDELLAASEETADLLADLFAWPGSEEPRLARLLYASRAAGPVEPVVDGRTADAAAMLRRSSIAGLRRQPGSRRGKYTIGRTEALERVDGIEFGPFTVGDGPSLLSLLLYYALLQEYVMARIRLGHLYADMDDVEVDRPDSGWMLLPEPEVRGWRIPTLWDTLAERIPEQTIGPTETALWQHEDVPRGSNYGNTLRAAPDLDASFADFVEALDALGTLPPDDLERLLGETLGLASYRLDAWATSIAGRRLRRDREDPTSDNGIYVGAYGWIENLTPRTRPQSYGYVHAPSLSQATTAAVLHSGYRAHDGEAFAVDLSPDRVQEGLRLLEGVRDSGRPLGDLLGYRFERGLHERHPGIELDRYIPEFRALAPATADAVDRDGEDPVAVERTAVRDRVDGLELYRIWRGDHNEKQLTWGDPVRESDDACPLPGANSAEARAIETELRRLEAAVDAVSDVLTAESVHQLVHDNPEAAAGSLDALSRGEAPPRPKVTDVHRSGTDVTHRLLALFEPRSMPLDSTGPQVRSIAEPTLAAWLEGVVGDLYRVVCLVEYEVPPEPEPASEPESGTEPEPTPESVLAEMGPEPEASETRRERTAIRLSELDLEPVDVLSLLPGDSSPRESELEGRIEYLLRRDGDRDTLPDGEIDITYAPPSEWPIPPESVGVDPATAIGVSEVFELCTHLRQAIAQGRSLDARDLTRPEKAGDRRLDTGTLADRFETVRPRLAALGEDLAVLGGLLRTREGDAAADATSRIDRLAAVRETVSSLVSELPDGRLETLGSALADLRADEAVADLVAVVETSRGDRAVLETDESRAIAVAPEVGQAIRGVANLPEGTQLQVRVDTADGNQWKSAIATVGSNGVFEVTFDFSDARPDTAFDITVDIPAAEGERTLAHVAGYVGEPTGDVRVRPIGPALARLLGIFTALTDLSAAGEPLREAIAAVDAAAIGAALERLEGSDTGGATARANGLLLLASLPLPGFDESDDAFATWHALAPLLETLAETDPDAIHRLDLSTFEVVADLPKPTHREAIRADLESLRADFADGVERIQFAAATPSDTFESLRSACLQAIRDRLFRLTHFGIHGSIPRSAIGSTEADATILADQAASVEREVDRRLDESDATDDPIDRLESLFGDGFRVLAPFEPTNADELRETFAPEHRSELHGGDPLAAETWLQRVARVRDRPRAFRSALTRAEVVGNLEAAGGVRVVAGQLPYDSPDAWVGLPDAWPESDEKRRAGRVSLVTHLESQTALSGDRLTGLFVDEWVETVPDREQTTGLAVHFDRPNTQPPQSVLIAVTPDGDRWTIDKLTDVVRETRSWSELRTVDSAALPDAGHLLPALYVARNSNVGPLGPDAPTVEFDALLDRE